ncbi:MAG: histidine--tRNA ligase [Spirochaetales bacterium]|nr:histidine--tRNA ligase [Spirochaetales bacterium]
MATNIIQPVKGMRDFYPEDWAYQKWLSKTWLGIGELFGYEEYEGPIVEPMELYLGKSSEEIVTEQTFTMEDRDGHKLVLRPELTPTFARMVARRENELTAPVRWQSYGSFFRYEKPQRGRGRSFFQWNVDCIGSESILADAEILTIAALALKNIGLSPKEAVIRVSDRAVMHKLLTDRLSIPGDKLPDLFGCIDRIDKAPLDVFKQNAGKLGLSDSRIADLLVLMEEKDPETLTDFLPLFSLLEKNGVREYFDLDLKIIRGFLYYTGTVFEAWAKTSLRRALFGGGRYDNLISQLGGRKNLPGIGFAIGDMAIYELLSELGKLPDLIALKTDVLVTVFSEETMDQTVSVANKLRTDGIRAEMVLEKDKKLAKQLNYANRKNIPFVLILGPDEIKKGIYVLKDLKEHSQAEMDYAALVKRLKRE